MSNNIADNLTQGETLLAVVGHAGLQTFVDQAVTAYLTGLEQALTAVLEAAEGLSGDGLDLSDFADLLQGKDL